MLNQTYLQMLNQKSMIRTLNEYGAQRAKEIGYQNVFDYSLGNPSVPTHPAFTQEMIRLLQEEDPVALHGYSPTLGIPSVRQAVAESLSRRFGLPYTADGIFMTSGAAGALAHALRAVTQPGDELIVFAPFFSEYSAYAQGAGLTLKVVPADTQSFQIPFDKLEEMLTDKVTALLINTPNNPSGAVYSAETLTRLAELLRKKSAELGRPLFLISDEPYREILFHGAQQPYPAAFYEYTLVCYSFSKSLSLPGERIGYVAVAPRFEGWEKIVPMCGQISRGTGHNCPSSIIQLAVSKVLELTSDLSVYETNADILCRELSGMGFEIYRPQGTFYIFPLALEEDAVRFCEKAKEFDLLLVPSDGFGVPGHFRAAYCIDTEKVERSLEAFKKLADCYR